MSSYLPISIYLNVLQTLIPAQLSLSRFHRLLSLILFCLIIYLFLFHYYLTYRRARRKFNAIKSAACFNLCASTDVLGFIKGGSYFRPEAIIHTQPRASHTHFIYDYLQSRDNSYKIWSRRSDIAEFGSDEQFEGRFCTDG